MKAVRPTLKVKFVDFWRDLNSETNNYFFQVLSEKYDVVFSDTPDILFYSCYGKEYLKYNCTKIFYTGENMRPDFTGCDHALSFDYIDHPRHFRLPCWVIDYNFYVRECNYPPFTKSLSETDARAAWEAKKKFCCIFVSNPNAPERIRFFELLNSKLTVDSAGRWNNTIGYYLTSKANEKVEFCKEYRFVISFENSSYDGYTTEKIIDAFFSHSIPIYWGDDLVGKDFNTDRFIRVKNEDSFNEVIDRILYLNQHPEEAIKIIQQSIFTDDKVPDGASKEKLLTVLSSWIEEARIKKFKGTSKGYKKYLHQYKLLKNRVSKSLKYRVGKLLPGNR